MTHTHIINRCAGSFIIFLFSPHLPWLVWVLLHHLLSIRPKKDLVSRIVLANKTNSDKTSNCHN